MARTDDNSANLLCILRKIEAHLAALRAEATTPSRSWLTVSEAANLLQVSRDTIERMITAGQLRAARLDTKQGRGDRTRYRIHRDWTDECLSETRPQVRNGQQFKRRRGKSQPIDYIG